MVRNTESTARNADAKGRVTLGARFSNRTVIVEERNGGDEVLVRLARVIPEREAWLYENAEALASVRRGLKQARSRKFIAGPDLKAARKLADQLEDN